jgi:hypothetical protein
MAAGEDSDEEAVDGLILTDDAMGYFLFEEMIVIDERGKHIEK